MALSRRRRVAVLLSVLAAAASTTAPPANAADWSRPQQLGPSGDQVDIAVNSRGDLAALWTSEHLAKARYRPAGADWRKPQKVGDGSTFAPEVVLDDRGWATAVWRTDGAAVKRPGEPWRPDSENPFTEADTFSAPPVMATSTEGWLYLGWTEYADAGAEGGGSWNVGHVRSPRNRWDSVSTGGSHSAVAWTPDRHLNVAHQAAGGGLAVTRHRPRSDRSSTVQLTDDGHLDSLRMVGNARGALVLVGVQRGADGGPDELVAFAKPANRPWRPLFSRAVPDVDSPTVALDDRGNVAISYVKRQNGAAQVRGRVLRVRGRAEGRTRALSPLAQDVASPSVALDQAGRAVFVWVGGRTAESFLPHAVVRSPRGRWVEQRRLAGADGTPASQPQVVARGRGDFTVVYVDERPMYVDLGR